MTEDEQIRHLMERAVAGFEPSPTIWNDNTRMLRRRGRRRPLQAMTAVAAAALAVINVADIGDAPRTSTDGPAASAAPAPVPLDVTCRDGWLSLDRYDAVAGVDGVPVRVINEAPQSWGPVSISFFHLPAKPADGLVTWTNAIIEVPTGGVVQLPLAPGVARLRCEYGNKLIEQEPGSRELTVTDPQGLWQDEDSEATCSLEGYGSHENGPTAEEAAAKVAADIDRRVVRRGVGYPGSDQRRFVVTPQGSDTPDGVIQAKHNADGSWQAYAQTCVEPPTD